MYQLPNNVVYYSGQDRVFSKILILNQENPPLIEVYPENLMLVINGMDTVYFADPVDFEETLNDLATINESYEEIYENLRRYNEPL